MGIFGLGGPEIAVIAGVAVLIFGKDCVCLSEAVLLQTSHLSHLWRVVFTLPHFAGPSKIPGLGKEVGKAAKSFQEAAKVCISGACRTKFTTPHVSIGVCNEAWYLAHGACHCRNLRMS